MASIKKNTPLNITVEYIIVDNASTNNEGVALENTFQNQNDCQVLRSQINLGFGAGNVLGAQQARGHYFAFINSDVLSTEDRFSEMVAFMKNHTGIAISGIQILNGEGEKTISQRPFEGVRYQLFGKKFSTKASQVYQK